MGQSTRIGQSLHCLGRSDCRTIPGGSYLCGATTAPVIVFGGACICISAPTVVLTVLVKTNSNEGKSSGGTAASASVSAACGATATTAVSATLASWQLNTCETAVGLGIHPAGASNSMAVYVPSVRGFASKVITPGPVIVGCQRKSSGPMTLNRIVMFS